jgi:hypothetical protein
VTLPNNQPPSPAIAFAVTGTGTATDGSGTTTADLAGRTQDAITALLKETEILGSDAWNAASTAVFDGLDASLGLAGAIVAKAVDEVGILIEDAGSSAASVLGVLGGLLNDAASLPGDVLSLIFGQQASQQAQINSAASGGFSYDPSVNGVTGWTTLTSTPLALSAQGAFIQAPVETVAYQSSGLSVDKYGINFVINPSMQGVCGMGICADSAGASWVGLLAYRGFNSDALWLVTAASPTLWVVQKEADLTGANRMSGLTTLDLKTDGVSTFSAELNGNPVVALNWTDPGIATHNSTHRGVILMTNGQNGNQNGFYGPAFAGKAVSYAA